MLYFEFVRTGDRSRCSTSLKIFVSFTFGYLSVGDRDKYTSLHCTERPDYNVVASIYKQPKWSSSNVSVWTTDWDDLHYWKISFLAYNPTLTLYIPKFRRHQFLKISWHRRGTGVQASSFSPCSSPRITCEKTLDWYVTRIFTRRRF